MGGGVNDHVAGGDQSIRVVGMAVGGEMKGSLQKTLTATHLPCFTCRFFRDDDPDLFYCEQHCEEFPALCPAFTSRFEWNRSIGCVPLLVGDD